MINQTHGDPDQIAAQLLFTERSDDPHVFAELQQLIGNGQTLKVREAIARTRQDAIDRAVARQFDFSIVDRTASALDPALIAANGWQDEPSERIRSLRAH